MAASASGDRNLVQTLAGLGPGMLAGMLWSVLTGQPRSVADDAARAIPRLGVPLEVTGTDSVPLKGPYVLVANHFQAPGVWIGVVAAALSWAVAERRSVDDLHWLAISEWRWFEVAGRWVPNPLTSLVFPRACRVWGLVPTPARPSDVAGRAGALRKILALLGRGNDAPARLAGVGVFPEGTATVALAQARPGVGAFLAKVSARGVPLVPVGVYYEEGKLILRFGEQFDLKPQPSAADLDDWARERVMVAIGSLLPRRFWGVYAEAIGREMEAAASA